MNKNELKNSILKSIITNGIESSKADIFGDNPMEDKVYTKRININAEFGEGINTTEIVCVSLTSDTPSFDTITDNDKVRINTKNPHGAWCNLFINEVPKEMLEFIYSKL